MESCHVSSPRTSICIDKCVDQKPSDIEADLSEDEQSKNDCQKPPLKASHTSTSLDEKPQLYSSDSDLSSYSESTTVRDSSVLTSPPHSREFRGLDKFDKVALAALTLGTIIILGPVAFLPFLWASNYNNPLWHWIVSKDRLHTVVVGLAGAIETGVSAQIAVIVAMVAALLLECGQVSLGDSAPFSVARSVSSASSVLPLLRRQIMNKACPRYSLLGFVVPLTALAIFATMHVVSILLVSDLGVAPVPGYAQTSPTAYTFPNLHVLGQWAHQFTLVYGYGALNAWKAKPQFYPTFAEYSEKPYEAEGVSDTGVNLRAFLPFASQITRQNLHTYNGTALVMDTRVTCQIPNLQNLSFALAKTPERTFKIRGLVGATRSTPRLNNSTIQSPPDWTNGDRGPFIYDELVPFECTVPFFGTNGEKFRSWKSTLCQLTQGPYLWAYHPFTVTGGLTSEFQDRVLYDNRSEWHHMLSKSLGKAHLLFNITEGNGFSWSKFLRQKKEGSSFNFTDDPIWVTPNNEWTAGEWQHLSWEFEDEMLGLSHTLCYSSLVTARVPVLMSSSKNRTEPAPLFDFETKQYDFKAVQRMMGQWGGDASDRGVLTLQNQGSWVVFQKFSDWYQHLFEPFIRTALGLEGQNAMTGWSGNISAGLWIDGYAETRSSYLSIDAIWITLFQEIVQSGGSVAFALQSLFTSMAGMVYYQDLPQFNEVANVTRTEYIESNIAVQWKGLIVVQSLVVVHFCLLATVVWMFLTRSKYSTIGETWPAISQLQGPAAEDIISSAFHQNEITVKRDLQRSQRQRTRVMIRYIEELDRIGVVEVTRDQNDGIP